MRLSQPPLRRLLARQRLPAPAHEPRHQPQTTTHRQIQTHARARARARPQTSSIPEHPPLHARYSSSSNSVSVSAATLKFGQPVHETHPHILKPGELTPGISAQEYADRRAALANALPAGGAAVLHAAPLQFKSGAVFHPYRQESNFFYLTGWAEPDAVAVVRKTGANGGDYAFSMFVKPKHPREEQWSGYRNGVLAARDVFNADEAWPIDDVASILPDILAGADLIHADPAPTNTGTPSSEHLDALSDKRRAALYPVMNRLRAVKSPAELAAMRLAGQISGRALTSAMRRAWSREKHLHAFLDHEFVLHGCDGPAYIPVVAGGERGNCIHYTANNALFHPGELIMVDAGGEYGGYVTDITRTWPVDGKFSPAQRDLYEAVLSVQRAGVGLCRESAHLSLEDIQDHTLRALVDVLRPLGFDVTLDNVDELFPHHVGHYVGLDVHDCPGLSRREILRRGHCVTIEPGVYVSDDGKWPSHFRGMGVRIEDSVCVDADNPFILTTEAVKEVVDIEALRE